MPDWGNSLKIVIGGHIAGAQSWSTSFWAAINESGGHLTQAQVDSVASALLTPLTTWWGTVKAYNGTDTQWDNYTVNYYIMPSHVTSLLSRSSVTAVPGTGSAGYPATQAMVCSLRSATPGRSGRGRMYVPITGAAVASSPHQFSLAQCSAVATATQTLLTSFNALTLSGSGISTQFVVVNSVRKALSYKVTKVIADSIPDFQDRRQNKLLASSLFSVAV